MSTLVILNLGSGDLVNGFTQVTVRLWLPGNSLPEQSVGSLPPAPRLIELYQTWQSIYRCMCSSQPLRSTMLAIEEDDLLEIDEVGITNISENSLESISQELCEELNAWLSARNFLKIERHMRSQLHPTEEIRIILETDNELLRHLPWHKWEIFQDYRKANIALSQSDYRCHQFQHTQILRNKIRILAILGDSRNIDVRAEREFLQNLPNAETTFLVNPSYQEFNTELWSPLGWDILFFAGHSQTEEKTGRLYINENSTNNSITIEKLEEALKASIERGLMLTIFNSCDGLGLASALEKLHIPAVVVMREPVPNRVAQEFLRYFLEAFAIDKLSFNRAMRRSCRKLQGLEEDFPGASWLPISCQNPAIELPTWLQLDGVLHLPLQVNLESESTTDKLILAPKIIQQPEPQLESNSEANITLEINSQPASIFTPEQYSHVQEILTELLGPIASSLIQQFKARSLTLEELVEELRDYLSVSQLTEFERQIIPLLQQLGDASITDTQSQQRSGISAGDPRISSAQTGQAASHIAEPTAHRIQVPINTPVVSKEQEITDVLVCEYKQALAEVVGPVAAFLVQDALASFPQISREKLIEILSAEIFEPQKAIEFRQRFLDSS